MRNNPTVILMLGHDKNLLETRQWVLQSRGYRVLTASSLAGIASTPRTRPVSLLLLCHSLSPAERETAVALANLRWPGVRHMFIAAEDMRAPNGILGNLLHTMDGPAKLISMVNEAIHRDGEPPQACAS